MSFLIPGSAGSAKAAPPRPLTDKVRDWGGRQGLDWATRNPATVADLDASYLGRFGVTRTDVNRKMLANVPTSASVLEIGCSAGRQLDALAEIGFTHLEGLDLSVEAIAMCKWPAKVGDGRLLPYEANSFDVVMTSGMFMHVPPKDKMPFVHEMQRVAKRWIYGCEMWTENHSEWDFGDLIPPAWTTDWCLAFENSQDWPIVERMMLTHKDGVSGAKPLQVYLLERP